MKKLTFILIILGVALMFSSAGSTPDLAVAEKAAQAGESEAAIIVDDSPVLPFDENVRHGEFDNGLQYYIRANSKPEQRVALRLVVNAGSVLEDDDQQGLAHFLEHMAFNGTANFKKQELVDYLESIGMRFGPDLNAYTSFDETVYMLEVPTDDKSYVEKGFQILEDWAHLMSLEDEEIEKERGVITEEWRIYRGADARMQDKQFPILFQGSKYAHRMPIGDMAVVDTSHYEVFHRFYDDWYRPDQMAVVAVGDLDPDYLQSLIEQHFAPLKNPAETRERQLFEVPDHDETLFAIATDPEADRTSVSIYFKRDREPFKTEKDYRRYLTERLFTDMLNKRLEELTKKPEPPFMYGYIFKGSFIRTKDFAVMGAGVKEDGIETGLDALLTEAERVKQFGFTQSELDRQKKEMLRDKEKEYNERDKTDSGRLARQYINHYLREQPSPGIAFEYDFYQRVLPAIELSEVNRLAAEWIRDKNRVITVNAPEKEGVVVPTEADLLAVFDRVAAKEITAYEDTVTDLPLVPNPPEPAPIIAIKELEGLGVWEWTLANGVKVVLKPTDFKNDEILLRAHSPGGHSVVPNADFVSADFAEDVINESGVADFSTIALEKMLSGRIVSLEPYIDELKEGFDGSAAPEDLETLLQLVYLYFTQPRLDTESFQGFLARMKGFLENRGSQPETVFRDSVNVIMADYHYRARPLTVEMLDEIDPHQSFSIFKDRFADASDFTFFLVGSFDPASIKPLVQTYLGGLPTTARDEKWADIGMDYPDGLIKKQVKKGLEPKSQVRIMFTGNLEWNRENRYALQSMTRALNIKMREALREDKGGTYGVGVWPEISRYPETEYKLTVAFGCNPERVAELIDVVFVEIKKFQTEPIDDLVVTKVKESQRRQHETDLKENRYWLSSLEYAYFNEVDPRNIITFPELVEGLSAGMIQEAAQKYFNLDEYVQVVLYPEENK